MTRLLAWISRWLGIQPRPTPPRKISATDCAPDNPWCNYREPHAHGLACDRNCPCWAGAV